MPGCLKPTLSDVNMSDDDHKIGYKRPPRETRFRPGQSGNPQGRPKNSRNFKTDLLSELQEEIEIQDNGQKCTVSKQRALIKCLLAAAIKGEMRATNTLLSICADLLADQTDEDHGAPASEDTEIVDAFLTRDRKRRGKHTPEDR
jgi:hypothetical protein